MRRRLWSLLPVLSSSLSAQAVLQVGPGRPFAQIAVAIASAQPGDVILVDAGNYAAIAVDRNVLIRPAVAGASVSVAGATVTGGPACLEGLRFTLGVTVAATVVTFDACTFDASAIATSAAVLMTDCVVANALGLPGPGTAFDANGATTLAAVRTTFLGGIDISLAPAALVARGTTRLQLSGCTLQGGTLSSSFPRGGAGLALRDAATGWLADCTITGGLQNGPAPGAAIDAAGTGAPLRSARGSFTGLVTPGATLSAPQVGIARSGPLLRGTVTTITVRTEPGYPVGLHLAFALGAPNLHPLLGEPEWGFAAASVPWSLQPADASGLANTPIAVPNDPALVHLRVWFCAWSAAVLPLDLSPPLAAVVR